MYFTPVLVDEVNKLVSGVSEFDEVLGVTVSNNSTNSADSGSYFTNISSTYYNFGTERWEVDYESGTVTGGGASRPIMAMAGSA